MPRHAGFALVATVTEKLVNDVAKCYFQNEFGPRFFPPPQTVFVPGFGNVGIGGLLEMSPPRIELRANPANAVTVYLLFTGQIRSLDPIYGNTSWRVQYEVGASIPVFSDNVNNQVVLGVNFAGAVAQQPIFRQLAGPTLPAFIGAAMTSPAMIAALTAFIQSQGVLTIAPPLLNQRIQRTQPGNFKDSNFSVFDWFTINLQASNVAVKVVQQGITVGLDFAGFTAGNPAQLVNLSQNGGGGAMYVQKVYQSTDLNAPPVLAPRSEPSGTEIATAINFSFISELVRRQIAPRIAGTPIRKDVVLDWITVGYTRFYKPLRGWEHGIELRFNVRAKGIAASGRYVLQPYLCTFDGPTNFIRADSWQIGVGLTEVDLPWWVNAALFFLTITVSLALPVMTPFMAVALAALLDGIIPGLVANIESQAGRGLGAAASNPGFPQPWRAPLPGLAGPNWEGMLRFIAVNAETLDVGIDTWIDWNENKNLPVGTIFPEVISGASNRPAPMRLQLRDDFARFAAAQNAQVEWVVRRGDTSAIVLSVVKNYNDPSGNGAELIRHTKDLYLVESFRIFCRVTTTIGNQLGEIWSEEKLVPVSDYLRRDEPFVVWGPHVAHFTNAGTNKEWWSHIRRSRIHRTATSARCLMLRRWAAEQAGSLTPIKPKYFSRPDIWDNPNQHRKILCEYCFFGGPDKTMPFPRDDWFIIPDIIFSNPVQRSRTRRRRL